MSAPGRAESTDTQEAIDLTALGRTWTPPQERDASPEVSDVLTDMPWWAARGLLYIIIGFVIAALLWASLSKVDVIVESRGALVPEGSERPVRAVGGGIVQHVFVRDGDEVERGQPIVQLDATELRSRSKKLRDELDRSEEQLRQLRETKGPIGKVLEKENHLARLQGEIASVELALEHALITAPTSGIITRLGARNAGTALQAGQKVAVMAPTGARLVVEVRVPNKDIAFVETGLPARLKFDAFPFQDYGSVPGTIIEVSPDAGYEKELGSFYNVTIVPDQTTIKAKGKPVALRRGLTLTAEIITERKTVLSQILEPFRQLKSEVGGAD